MIDGVSRSISNTVDFLTPYWYGCNLIITQSLFLLLRSLLKIWADYIVASLPNPGNQLCTDDFEGPSPHNVNLAAKVGDVVLQLATVCPERQEKCKLLKYFYFWINRSSTSETNLHA